MKSWLPLSAVQLRLQQLQQSPQLPSSWLVLQLLQLELQLRRAMETIGAHPPKKICNRRLSRHDRRRYHQV